MPVSSISNPSPEDALRFLESGFERGVVITVVGECEVEYEGRAASYLPPGERFIILKPDGTLLVHGDEGHEPINWQRSGSTRTAQIEDSRLMIESSDSKDDEEVIVRFENLLRVSTLDLKDGSDLELVGSEEDLRMRIFEDSELVEKGFQPQTRERETTAGPVDIFGYDRDNIPTVVELKRRRVGPAAVRQLDGYVNAISHELPVGRELRGILVAPSVTDRAADLAREKGYDVVTVDPNDFF